jgi:hypothetical protein
MMRNWKVDGEVGLDKAQTQCECTEADRHWWLFGWAALHMCGRLRAYCCTHFWCHKCTMWQELQILRQTQAPS